LAAIWAQVLGQDDQSIGINDEFLALGGDSLTATKLVSRIRKQLNADLTLIDFFDASTIAEQAIVLQRLLG
jgi:acyl carrier protein